jgi:D-3-phosphoglycerate dehydrogenase
MALAEKLGSLVGQLEQRITSVAIEVEGAAAELNQKPITGAVLAGLMRVYSDTVNMVNAPFLARERGLDVREVRHDREGDYSTQVRVTVTTPAGDRSVAGTLFANSEPRLVEIFGVKIEADLAARCSTSSTRTRPASSAARDHLGRGGRQYRHLPPRPSGGRGRGGGAAVDRLGLNEELLANLRQLPGVKVAQALRF